MLEKFLKFIQKHRLFSFQNQILLAVSGGIDSVVMAHLFLRAKLNFAIAHCHFSLRPEADQEARFVEQLAQNWGVRFFFRQFDTIHFAQQEKVSVQMAARHLRYDFFEQIRSQENYDYIATAHHLNDSLETALFNFSKGTGISGLRGILPKTNKIVRPLLFATRLEIEKFASENQIRWLEDSSNAVDKYQRNFIRHQIIPRLAAQINPNIVETFAETAQRLTFAEKILKNYFNNLKNEIWQTKGEVIFLKAQHAEAVILHHFLETLGFSFRQCQDMADCQQTGADFFSATHWAVKDRKQWVIVPTAYQEEISAVWQIERHTQTLQSDYFHLSFEYQLPPLRFAPPTEALYFDAEKLAFPLLLRSWQEGDKFHPLGMKGTKKISDFLIDEKVPKNLKKRIFVLVSNNEIVAILGMRSSEKFKVDTHTKQVWKVSMMN